METRHEKLSENFLELLERLRNYGVWYMGSSHEKRHTYRHKT